MKKVLFIATLLLSVLFIAKAQSSQTIKTEGAKTLTDIVETETQYLLPEFTDGIVAYKSGKIYKGKLNYNILVKEVQFLSSDSRVQALVDQPDIKQVNIGDRILINSEKGITEVLYQKDDILFVLKRIVKQAEQGTNVGYGQVYTGSGHNYSSISSGSSQGQLTTSLNVAPDEIIVRRTKEFFLVKDQEFYSLNKKGFTKAFSSHKKEIEAYIKDQNIDFKNENDVKRLIDYCASL